MRTLTRPESAPAPTLPGTTLPGTTLPGTTLPGTTQPESAPKAAWVITDASTKQKGRQLAPGIFEFKEKRFGQKVRATIVLADYSEERRNYYAEAYYGSLVGLMKDNFADWPFILAECIFEQQPQEGV